MRVRDVRPGRDAVDAGAVLVLHGAADVGELAVLEDEEAVVGGEGLQGVCEGGDGGGRAEADYVDVGFDEADYGAEAWLRLSVRCVGWEGRGGAGRAVGVRSMRARIFAGSVRSADRQRFDFLASMIESSRRPTAVGWVCERLL